MCREHALNINWATASCRNYFWQLLKMLHLWHFPEKKWGLSSTLSAIVVCKYVFISAPRLSSNFAVDVFSGLFFFKVHVVFRQCFVVVLRLGKSSNSWWWQLDNGAVTLVSKICFHSLPTRPSLMDPDGHIIWLFSGSRCDSMTVLIWFVLRLSDRFYALLFSFTAACVVGCCVNLLRVGSINLETGSCNTCTRVNRTIAT